MFKKFRRNSAVARLIEEQLYEQVTAELDQGIRRAGLWGKAVAKSRGNESEALALYMQLRVQSLRDGAEIAGALIEEGHNHQEILDYKPVNQSQAESIAEEELKEVKSQLEKEKQESASLAREMRWKEKVANERLRKERLGNSTQYGTTVEDDIIKRARASKVALARPRINRDAETDDITVEYCAEKASYWAGIDEQKAKFWAGEVRRRKKLEKDRGDFTQDEAVVDGEAYKIPEEEKVAKEAVENSSANTGKKNGQGSHVSYKEIDNGVVKSNSWGWIWSSIVGITIMKLFGIAGGLVTIAAYYWLQPKVGTWGSVVVSGVLGVAAAVGLTLMIQV